MNSGSWSELVAVLHFLCLFNLCLVQLVFIISVFCSWFGQNFAFSLSQHLNRHDFCLVQLGFDISTCMLFGWSKVCFFLYIYIYESIDRVTTFAVLVWFNWVLIILLVWWWLGLKIVSFIVEVSKSGWWYTVMCEFFLYSEKLLKKWAVFTLLN